MHVGAEVGAREDRLGSGRGGLDRARALVVEWEHLQLLALAHARRESAHAPTERVDATVLTDLALGKVVHPGALAQLGDDALELWLPHAAVPLDGQHLGAIG
jgi:hypothetical protein